MIIVIDALNKHRFQGVLDEMHKLRARVFQGRLGWDVTVRDGREADVFDSLDPAHVVCLDADGDVVGCMRLLQTTGPHMLSDVFNDLLDGEPPLRSSRIWEATRFCVDTAKLGGGKTRNSISYVTSEVMIGAFEYAREAGVLDAVAVIDPVMNRVMIRSANAPCDYLGSPKPMGKVTAMAALMDCSEDRIQAIRDFAEIRHDVFLTEDSAEELFQRNRAQQASRPAAARMSSNAKTEKAHPMPAKRKTPRINALQLYCCEQILNAKSQSDINAAQALVEALSDKLGTNSAAELCRMTRASARGARQSVLVAAK
ncbi:MAG: acyl-homoserine-lactone synthase [Antarcticimicrobium sp.]|uniref:acyl-homoserine-lactone synthase n=1 Tax=Antarcticimicrobium sp. TaxID=2824147 RepID=UPI00262D2C30|nr:acyl-homoserine-lactone synthase [Antarcticimicrobium sp.]MDF1716443.1 acyl-homoserine-lactone synthase [Antarcticimicrobium sp.]